MKIKLSREKRKTFLITFAVAAVICAVFGIQGSMKGTSGTWADGALNADLKEMKNEIASGVTVETLVNKDYPIAANYKPSDLVKIQGTDILLSSAAAEHLEKMIGDMKKAGYAITLSQGYRSFDDQMNLFDEKVVELKKEHESKSEDAIRELAAAEVSEPGTSEHQTGFAVDFAVEGVDEDQLLTSGAYQWIEENAYQYGFILRYPEGKGYLTGVGHKPAHLRYVGQDLAENMHTEGLCMEEHYNSPISSSPL